MKKTFSIIALLLIGIGGTFMASEISTRVVSGKWYSSIDMNYDGITEVGTTNKSGGNHSYLLDITDQTDGLSEFSDSFNVSDNEMATTGVVWTTVGHRMQGIVDPQDSSEHSPWFNAR